MLLFYFVLKRLDHLQKSITVYYIKFYICNLVLEEAVKKCLLDEVEEYLTTILEFLVVTTDNSDLDQSLPTHY